MKLLIVEDDRALDDGIALSLKADADTILQACTLSEAEKLFAKGVDLVGRSGICGEKRAVCGHETPAEKMMSYSRIITKVMRQPGVRKPRDAQALVVILFFGGNRAYDNFENRESP